ncbi:MAG: SDR family oxidoreductase [Caulobacteraceae bacterium]|nr:SDR family oxidoreductase [Caulobacteraceae bacterium]
MQVTLKDKAVLAIGATQRIARACVEAVASCGADLALVSRDDAALEAQAHDLSHRYGVQITTHPADVTDPVALQNAIDTAISVYGARLKGLLPLVGSWDGPGLLHELTDDNWRFAFERIVLPVTRSAHAVLPHFMAHGGGSIVTLGAYSARVVNPVTAHYSSMKAAVIHITKNIAKAYGAHKIGANCVCPSVVVTEELEARRKDLAARYGVPDAEALWTYARDAFHAEYFLEELGDVRDIGAAVAFLMSDQSRYTTGAVLNVDGGTNF